MRFAKYKLWINGKCCQNPYTLSESIRKHENSEAKMHLHYVRESA